MTILNIIILKIGNVELKKVITSGNNGIKEETKTENRVTVLFQ